MRPTDSVRPPRSRSAVTLKTIATEAGVHVSTVSRALRRAAQDGTNATPGDVRILEIAEALGYVPNPNAASLTTRRSHSFGVLVPQLTDAVLATVYDAVEETANAAGYATFVANTRDDPVEQLRQVSLLLGRAVDGLIIGDARLDNNNIEQIASRGVDVVLVNRRSGAAVHSTSDDILGGDIAGSHLLNLGHRRLGVIGGPSWVSTTADRLSGFRAALSRHGIPFGDEAVRYEGFDVAAGRRGMESLLASGMPPTGVFVMNDEAAIGALGVLRDRGLTPGEDVSIIGFNDIPIARELFIPLTTVRISLRQMGVRAVESMLTLIHGLPTSSSAQPPELVVRATTGPAPLSI